MRRNGVRRRGTENVANSALIQFTYGINKVYTWHYTYLKVPLARFRIHQSDVITRTPTTAPSSQNWWIKWTRSVKNSTGWYWSTIMVGRRNLRTSYVGVPGKPVCWSTVCLECTKEVMYVSVFAYACHNARPHVQHLFDNGEHSNDFLFPNPMLSLWNSHHNNIPFDFVFLTVVSVTRQA